MRDIAIIFKLANFSFINKDVKEFYNMGTMCSTWFVTVFAKTVGTNL